MVSTLPESGLYGQENASLPANTPFWKLLKKKSERKIGQAGRQIWGKLNPVTGKPENSNAYNRRKSQNWKRELPPTACDFSFSA